MNAVFVFDPPSLVDRFFTPELVSRLRRHVEIDPELVLTAYEGPELARAEILITGWGAPMLDTRALAAAPNLRYVVHTAGTVKWIASPEVYARGIQVSSQAAANAVPVAEYTLAMILLANKRVWELSRTYTESRRAPSVETIWDAGGNAGRTVGVIGASAVGRKLLDLLRPFELHALLYDPTLASAEGLNAELVELPELMSRSDVVTIHAPELPQTRHLVGADEIALMRPGATLINTARPSLVDQDALTKAVRGGRVHAVLDVAEPDEELFALPGVLLTPHVAGSVGTELHRLAANAVAEVANIAAGLPLSYAVDPATQHLKA
ncbi:hydroxyacid dehydrogenase [Nonomuraea sp. K274]|uniref:Hydroxyacid dehydrogenase n=1 Tax=Nonomuraea cypriaca TaxID=1187855 RepID=A0A931AHF2_9ACTN|nr:hydroxyacid dehydrogenase [Nonomuraea cypriaca]MBF8191715.1 hydroxyacid dehydrogenase [Nonomuraea cypriaca]